MFTEEFKENIFYFNKPAESKKIVTQEEVCQTDEVLGAVFCTNIKLVSFLFLISIRHFVEIYTKSKVRKTVKKVEPF